MTTLASNRNYRLLFSASAVSNLGDDVSALAFPWLATLITRDPALIALVAFATRLPWLLFAIPAGHDDRPRRPAPADGAGRRPAPAALGRRDRADPRCARAPARARRCVPRPRALGARSPGTRAPRWPGTPSCRSSTISPSTSAIRSAPGSAEPTRTTGGLLRQYFPKGTDLSLHGPGELEAVALALNGRPCKTLGWRTPAEALDELLTTAHDAHVATTG